LDLTSEKSNEKILPKPAKIQDLAPECASRVFLCAVAQLVRRNNPVSDLISGG
jgi:hypothetical protein